ncbi:MAG: 1-(5-phosphoribosyl)-5-[(5-phosphoribosylamino)methylideneamino]imidazole-4-carboxamide isomerase [Rikenellaceae bacterium]|nr:1-(5-phosphoribosyl)-5-[(5-phosphoribosylamino)methylideneamino]imidazole-4-carboxamide isomerase [Rikenellaceae bacterium]
MIEIIPAIDIIGGECVRLTRGDYDRKTGYTRNILDLARSYEAAGVRRLHMVDLDGAKASFPQNLRTLEEVASHTGLEVQYGGGVKSLEALQSVFDAGAHRAICGSVAVSEPENFRRWLLDFGPERMILGADVRDGLVATHGWLRSSELGAGELLAMFTPDGLARAICTDISRDGMLQGPAFDLYAELQNAFPLIEITASGGISSAEDIVRLDAMGVRSVIVGKAIYEGKIDLNQITKR